MQPTTVSRIDDHEMHGANIRSVVLFALWCIALLPTAGAGAEEPPHDLKHWIVVSMARWIVYGAMQRTRPSALANTLRTLEELAIDLGVLAFLSSWTAA